MRQFNAFSIREYSEKHNFRSFVRNKNVTKEELRKVFSYALSFSKCTSR